MMLLKYIIIDKQDIQSQQNNATINMQTRPYVIRRTTINSDNENDWVGWYKIGHMIHVQMKVVRRTGHRSCIYLNFNTA